MITRDGEPVAVLLAPDALDALEETVGVLSSPGAWADLRAARAEIEAGTTVELVRAPRR